MRCKAPGAAPRYTPGGRYTPRDDTLTDVLPRLSSGDPGAAEECLDRYGALVWSLARRHTVSSADAEDAVQDIFLDVWKNAGRFDATRASEAAFITMIARRRLIDRRRRSHRRPQTLSLDVGFELADPLARQPEAAAEVGLAARAIARLEPKERQVVLLSAHQGMSHSQIAAHTGMPLGTVKTYARRGLMRVREQLRSRPGNLGGVEK